MIAFLESDEEWSEKKWSKLCGQSYAIFIVAMVTNVRHVKFSSKCGQSYAIFIVAMVTNVRNVKFRSCSII